MFENYRLSENRYFVKVIEEIHVINYRIPNSLGLKYDVGRRLCRNKMSHFYVSVLKIVSQLNSSDNRSIPLSIASHNTFYAKYEILHVRECSAFKMTDALYFPIS